MIVSSSVTTAEETIALFDGKTLDGWVTLDDKPVTEGWEVVDDGHIEHWLSGKKIVEATIGSKDWEAKVGKNKGSSVKDFARGPGVILLQEHLSEAWFKNIRITPLTKTAHRSDAITTNGIAEDRKPTDRLGEDVFAQASAARWKDVFSDAGTGEWKEKWFLDGQIGSVKTGPSGMELTAGPEFKNDAHHMVLWTKESFRGDLKIDYDYTRLDSETRCVNILYIQATGSGEEPYAKDIARWNALRRVPAMRMYYDHMHAYHISYAAFPNSGSKRVSYIRARRYMPSKTGLKGTDLKPDYYPKCLFATGIEHNITVIKKDRDIFMRVRNPEQVYYCHMTNPTLPVINEGRIGLRHMFTRSARYKNIYISTPMKKQ